MKVKELLVIWLVLVGLIGWGWIKNIVALTECDFKEPYKAEVIRVVGIVPPIGAIVGHIDVGK